MKKIAIVVPAYNEEDVIDMFYNETHKVLKELDNNYTYEMIFIDDGSKDTTLEKLKQLAIKDKKIKIISFSRNFGKEAAIYAGLQSVNGDIAVVMDADLQNDPIFIKQMLKYIEEGYDSVTTIRNRKGESKIKSGFSKMFYRIMNGAENVDLKQGSQDFRMMTKQVVDAILSLNEYNRFSKGIFNWVGFKTKYIEVQNRERAAGVSKWSYKKLFGYAVNGLTSFSVQPLKIATFCGSFISIVSLILAVQIVIQTLVSGKEVPGYASTITAVLFIGGIQLITIGILSTYVGKLYMEIKRRPQYIIKEKIEGGTNEKNT